MCNYWGVTLDGKFKNMLNAVHGAVLLLVLTLILGLSVSWLSLVTYVAVIAAILCTSFIPPLLSIIANQPLGTIFICNYLPL